jgi:hypothetical protein
MMAGRISILLLIMAANYNSKNKPLVPCDVKGTFSRYLFLLPNAGHKDEAARPSLFIIRMFRNETFLNMSLPFL